MLADEDSDDKFVIFGWLKLRRMGYEVDWDAMDDIVLSFDMADAAGGPYERAAAHNLAVFCRYWRMTPRQVDELSDVELAAFWKHLEDEIRAQERAARKARRGR